MRNRSFTYKRGQRPFLTYTQRVRAVTAGEKWKGRKGRIKEARRLVASYRFRYMQLFAWYRTLYRE